METEKQEDKVFTFLDSANLCVKTLKPPIRNSKILYFEQSKRIENSVHKKVGFCIFIKKINAIYIYNFQEK